ncbi:MAG: hypothetical protein ACTHMY_13830 [Solirubrobacteraceae bacterium]
MSPIEQLAMLARDECAVSPEGDNSPIEWRGLPRFVPVEKPLSLVLWFEDEAAPNEAIENLDGVISKTTGRTV